MESRGLSAGERLSQQNLVTQRKNLLGISKMCVKSLVDKAAFEAVGDDCGDLDNFCAAMEHVFTHRIQVRWRVFGSSDSQSFWPLLSRLAPPITVSSVQDMENITSEIGRCRAWIRLMLVQKRLSHFMTSLLSKQDLLQADYLPGAFLVSEELTELAGTVKCLDNIDFNLCLRDRDFDLKERREIDYSLYLLFNQSHSSQVDDFFEEQKLSSNRRVSFPWQPELWAGSGEVVVDGEGGEVGGGGGGAVDTPTHLRELLKTEREQKNYFEELVSVRDKQLARLQLELTSVGEEREKERAELEVVIIELQQQLEQKQSELRALQQSVGSSSTLKPRASTFSKSHSPPPANKSPIGSSNIHNSHQLPPPPPPSSSNSKTGGRPRNSSFSLFSSFLGPRSNT
ncbi:RUN domain-containing protein 3A [Geodia barretti]|uniref:RUN domain-containing protein 3A n=1 Tax=Geodia barretti TaxID=519541 RepID=A0AA35SZW9_GEOBA|nr:RUN domain-containing protein 3A [Geodia barretti]